MRGEDALVRSIRGRRNWAGVVGMAGSAIVRRLQIHAQVVDIYRGGTNDGRNRSDGGRKVREAQQLVQATGFWGSKHASAGN